MLKSTVQILVLFSQMWLLSACSPSIFSQEPTYISKPEFPTRKHASKIAVFIQDQNSNQNSNQHHLSLLNLIKQGISRLNKTDFILVPQKILTDSIHASIKTKAIQTCDLSCIFEIANQEGIHELILVEEVDQITIQLKRYQS